MAASSTERVDAAQVRRGLQRADDRPLDRGVHLPPVHPVAGVIASPPAAGVRAQQLGERTEATHLAAAAEAPGRRAQPPDVLGRVARVGQLPVEDAAQPVRPDQEVAHPEVAVHRHPRSARRAVGRQPAHAELERGPDLAQGIEEGQRVAQRVGRREGPRWPPGRWCGWRPGRARPVRSARGGRRPTRRRAGSCAGSSRPPAGPPPTSSPRARRPHPWRPPRAPARPRRRRRAAGRPPSAPGRSGHRRRGPSAG